MTYTVTGKTERTVNGVSLFQLDLSNDQNMGSTILMVPRAAFEKLQRGDSFTIQCDRTVSA